MESVAHGAPSPPGPDSTRSVAQPASECASRSRFRTPVRDGNRSFRARRRTGDQDFEPCSWRLREFGLPRASQLRPTGRDIPAIPQGRERGKAKDYYDVWRLLKVKHFKGRDIKNLVLKKCESKDAKFTGLTQIFPDNLPDVLKSHMKHGLTRLSAEPLPDIEITIVAVLMVFAVLSSSS